MLTLHHNDMSSCSQKVRFVLEEKQINWSSEELNLGQGDQFKSDYVALNPKAVVPTVIHEEKVVVESAIICQYLDENFPGRTLTPKDPYGRAKMRIWMQPIDEYLHADISVISHAIAFADEIYAANSTEEKLASYLSNIADPDKRALRRELITQGTEAGPFKSSLWRYKKFFSQISHVLKGSKYLLGGEMTLADVVCLPYVLRFHHLNQAHLLAELDGIEDWCSRMFDTDGYRKGLEKWFSPKGIDNMMSAGERKYDNIQIAWNQVSI